MTCPPCTNECNEGRTCPLRKNKIIEEDDDIQEYKKPWVGLTNKDFYGQSELQMLAMKYAEAKLKERNT